MEHPTEEIAAKAEAARAELRRKASNITLNTTEPEGFKFVAMEHPTEEIAAEAEAARAELRRKACNITVNTTESEGSKFVVMEHLAEEIAAKAEAARAELRRKARNITSNTIEPQGFRLASPTSRVSSGLGSSAWTTSDMVKDCGPDRGETSLVFSTSTLTNSYPMNYAGLAVAELSEGFRFTVSSALPACTSSVWARSSTLTDIDTVRDHALDGGVVSLAHLKPTLENPCLINDAGLTVETMRNYGYSNARVGCSSTKEEITHEGSCSYHLESKRPKIRIGGSDLTSTDKGSLELSLRDDLTRMPQSFEDAEHLLSTRNNVDSSRISTHLTEGSSKIISSDRYPVSSWSKTLNSASFYNYFLEQSRTMPTAFAYINSRGQNRSNSMLMSQSKNSSETASDGLMNKNVACSLLAEEGPELPHHGINLRKWLESNGCDVSKNDKLHLFKQIVQTVDVAHSQGIAFLDLRPSSFILLEMGHVKYTGSVVDAELSSAKQDNTKKRGLEPETFARDRICVNMQKVNEDKLIKQETCSSSRSIYAKGTDQFKSGIIDMKKFYASKSTAQNVSVNEGTSREKCWTSERAQLEKKWYAFPEGFNIRDLFSFNIYCLGLLLFEFLCRFESMETHSAAMLDLHYRILPPRFLSENPKEAGFCFWLLHPEPSSRPSTREILQSELMCGFGSTSRSLSNDEASCDDIVDDAESDLLLHFLVSLKKYMQNKASNLLGSMEILDSDIKEVERRHASRKYLETSGGGYNPGREPYLKDDRSTGISYSSSSGAEVLRDKLLGNVDQLENAYFSLRSHEQLTEMPDVDRPDKDVLRNRDRWSWGQKQQTLKEKSVDRIETFFEGICKFARYSKFEVCGTLRNGDILNSNNVICSLSFDREEEYIAAAGVSKKIKIFELSSLLNDEIDVQYPVLEMTNQSKFSCICWNNYIKNYLASTDYDGLVQMWDSSTGQGLAQYKEHQKRAWSVDFSQADPTKFASGGDDCSVRIWNINERNSIGTIWNPANVCCVQFSPYSSHLLAFGSADYRIYCYDIRHIRIPWCTLAGHGKTVSYVRFLDSGTMVSASTDSTSKLWDLKKTSSEGLSLNACNLTFSGHTNEKNFVGLAVLDGYIACGSETNEVYAYYKSLPMPITSHKIGRINPISGNEIDYDNSHFVSSVCWRIKSQMLASANSNGNIEILRMV